MSHLVTTELWPDLWPLSKRERKKTIPSIRMFILSQWMFHFSNASIWICSISVFLFFTEHQPSPLETTSPLHSFCITTSEHSCYSFPHPCWHATLAFSVSAIFQTSSSSVKKCPLGVNGGVKTQETWCIFKLSWLRVNTLWHRWRHTHTIHLTCDAQYFMWGEEPARCWLSHINTNMTHPHLLLSRLSPPLLLSLLSPVTSILFTFIL